MRKPQSTTEKLESFEDERLAIKENEKRMMPWLIGIPSVAFLITLCLTREPGAVIVVTMVSVFLAFIIHGTTVGIDFDKVKNKVRKALIKEFMTMYHPYTQYKYYPSKKSVEEIVGKADLVSGVNRYNEEDVITGTRKGAQFYFSEIHLKKISDKNTITKFKGILFNLKLPGQNFPKSKIQSNNGLLSKLFGSSYHNEKFDLYINSKDPHKLEEDLDLLFPFIAHLSKEQGDIRIATHGNEITILMNSDMKFLDNPSQNITKSFLEETYRNNIAKQMNTLLFIVDAFINNANTTEIEERFELKNLIKLRESAQ